MVKKRQRTAHERERKIDIISQEQCFFKAIYSAKSSYTSERCVNGTKLDYLSLFGPICTHSRELIAGNSQEMAADPQSGARTAGQCHSEVLSTVDRSSRLPRHGRLKAVFLNTLAM